MEESRIKSQVKSRYLIYYTLSMITFYCCFSHVIGQTIGHNPQFNFGFNPYTSPVFGYGLGLPFGAYSMNPTRYPWLLSTAPITPFADKHGFISKIHAKAFLKKLASSQAFSSGYYGLKDKINLMKHPEFAFTPYSAAYGYGKHYGAAMVPNNPYKSTYGDFYEQADASGLKPITTSTGVNGPIHGQIPIGGRLPESSISGHMSPDHVKAHSHILKPFIKAGALLTTAALLGKKVLESPIRLSPSGMILSDLKP